MISLYELTQVIFLLYLFLALASPLATNKYRFYLCYSLYMIHLNFLPVLFLPLLLIFPTDDPACLGIFGNIARLITFPLGIHWTIRGGENFNKNQGSIIVANHQSVLDILGIMTLHRYSGTYTALAKKFLLVAFPFGPLAWLCGLIFIDRKSSKSCQNGLKASSSFLKKGVKIWIFPEGTRNRSEFDFLPFKSGAFRLAVESQTPISPVVFSPYYFINESKRTFQKGEMVLSVLPAVSTEGMTLDDVEALKTKVCQLMLDEFNRLKGNSQLDDKICVKVPASPTNIQTYKENSLLTTFACI